MTYLLHMSHYGCRLCLILQLLMPAILPALVISGVTGPEAPDFSRAALVSNQPAPDNYKPALDDGTPWTVSTKIRKSRLSVLIGGLLLGDAIGFAKIADLQYTSETTTFHFHDWNKDIRVFKQMDKTGHVVESYYMSHLASKIYRWSGFSARKSIFWGSLTGIFWMTQIEVTDAFFKAWGFSYLDYAMNIIGSGYAGLQQLYPEQLRGIRFKFSFYPSNSYLEGKYNMASNSLLDDYEGFTWWLAFNFHDIMPERWRAGYPGWLSPLGIAVGQSIDRLSEEGNFGGVREIFIGLDIDVTKIPTGDSKLLKFMKDEFNFVRLPLPAVRVTPRGVWYGIYF